MSFKDHFSGHAQAYGDARPSYPDELFEFLDSQCEQHDLVWGCATGNGQAAVSLAKIFKRVIATDGSAEQVEQAQQAENIEYRQMTAEQPLLEKNSCDLITVAQALHWFDTENSSITLKPASSQVVCWRLGAMRFIRSMSPSMLLWKNCTRTFWAIIGRQSAG